MKKLNKKEKKKSTASEKIGNKYYCIYCANECEHDTEYWDQRENTDIYYCECEAAKAELEYDKEYNILKEKYKNILFPNEEKLKQLRFKQQVIELSYKYGIHFKNEYLDNIKEELK
jgi:hypothetical protein